MHSIQQIHRANKGAGKSKNKPKKRRKKMTAQVIRPPPSSAWVVPAERKYRSWRFGDLKVDEKRKVSEQAREYHRARMAAAQYRRRTGRRIAIARHDDGSIWAWRQS
jgi:hypothetical protein